MTHHSNFNFENLELHDGDLGEISSRQEGNGNWSLSISIHLKSMTCRLLFVKCRLIKIDIKGGMARPDVVDKYCATRDSEIFHAAGKWPSPLPDGSFHYSITTNSGSRIDVVAEGFEQISES